MIVLLFGPPGVGKGTQADLITQRFNYVKFSMGDVLREEVALGSPVGKEVEKFMKQGVLAPDNIIFEIVSDFLLENKPAPILFDGFPRNINQALNLEKTTAQLNLAIDHAIEMSIPEEYVIQRLVNRRYCPGCGAIYNLVTNPPKKTDHCDKCPERLLQRPDDNETTIRKRLQIYRDETKPLTDYYKSLNLYRPIDARGSQEEVFQRIALCLNGNRK
jgi:adenylate kinase